LLLFFSAVRCVRLSVNQYLAPRAPPPPPRVMTSPTVDEDALTALVDLTRAAEGGDAVRLFSSLARAAATRARVFEKKRSERKTTTTDARRARSRALPPSLPPSLPPARRRQNAAYTLHCHYRDGTGGVDANPKKRELWFERCLALDVPLAHTRRGVDLTREAKDLATTGPCDDATRARRDELLTRAFEHYRRAASQGERNAENNLGNCYAEARGRREEPPRRRRRVLYTGPHTTAFAW
jgi:hypothetical protein